MGGRRAIGGETRNGLADLADAEEPDADRPHGGASLRLPRADAKGPIGGCGRRVEGRQRRFSSLPGTGRELAPAAHLPAEGSAGKRPGCCGIVGPGPSATLDTRRCRLSGKTESMYFDLMIRVKY